WPRGRGISSIEEKKSRGVSQLYLPSLHTRKLFGIAVSNETVNITERFPYISECGTYNPQSCIFAQICNVCAVLALWVVVIRFQQVRDYGQNSKVNIASIVLGFISCVGISIIGNFQQSVGIGIHLLGAFLAFFVGLAYFWLQVWLCYKAHPFKDRHWVGPLRATFCSICTVLVITMAILHNTSYKSGAAVCEWALVMSFLASLGLSSVTSTSTSSPCRNKILFQWHIKT
uniref:Transmembrane protein 150B n=1 Tax=Salmo trutta TaxID=8032 RepID=A0A673YME1_SALTR